MTFRPAAAPVLLLALVLAGCGSHRSTSTTILGGSAQDVSFGQVRSAVQAVYRSHPGVASYTVRNVAYTPATRDRVLAACHDAGGSAAPGELETSRIEACAPLIFFFYRYGQHASATDSTALARDLYWYAATNVKGPVDARSSLRSLLSGWGVK